MLSFKQFLKESEAKLRQGLPSVLDLKADQFNNLIKNKKISGNVTEKSDGMAFEVGHDEHGFYSRTSRSDKMRQPGDYERASREKFGERFNPEISKQFDTIHQHLQNNKHLANHLASNPGKSIKGEVFYKPSGKQTASGEIRFVGTAYDPKKMAKHGSFIVHSKLPENAHLDINHVKQLGDSNFNIDSDETGHNLNIDVAHEHEQFSNLNHELMKSRKKADKENKNKEIDKFVALKNSVNNKIQNSVSHLQPKWGSETEGYVIHPDKESNADAPRVKVISDTFKQNKQNFSFDK